MPELPRSQSRRIQQPKLFTGTANEELAHRPAEETGSYTLPGARDFMELGNKSSETTDLSDSDCNRWIN